ncbi:MAG: sterol desaturase family protein [Myxococcales bacterium]|nr:sterol desaturase family protein [Myxococcales bacterium]
MPYGSSEPTNLVAYVLPLFLGAIVVEWLWTRKSDNYNLGTALSDVGTGGVFQGLELLFHLALLPAYAWLYDNASLITFGDGAWQPLVIGFIGVDLLFYWWHRASHVINVLWAVHGVHHQSEDFNLAVALRQPAFEPLTWFIFYAPLALVGVDLPTYLICYTVNRFYQFWIHTEVVRTLGPLEWLFNTPSHHRVHHGVQELYLDRNYGAIFIVWDRIFGTFQREEQAPLYGTTVPLASYNPVWANLKLLRDIVELSRRATTVREKLWAWVAHPAWQPIGPAVEPKIKRTDESYHKYRPAPPPRVTGYVALHYGIIALLAGPFLLNEHAHSTLVLLTGAGTLIGGHLNLCALVENKRWALGSEVVRVGLMLTTIYLSLGSVLGEQVTLGLVVGLGLVSAGSWTRLLPVVGKSS